MSRGFTLLEVLVAMVILGLAVVTLIQLASHGLRLIKASGDHQEAVRIAERLVREVTAPREGVEAGRDGIYAWERRVTPVPLPPELAPPAGRPTRLFRLSVAVRWSPATGVEIATLLAAPPAPAGASR
jgi:prepilin-type N-terminal cleavage/methylation domain-containing protein